MNKNRVVRKLQFLNNFLRKSHFCRALARKNARLVREPTGFPNKSNEKEIVKNKLGTIFNHIL